MGLVFSNSKFSETEGNLFKKKVLYSANSALDKITHLLSNLGSEKKAIRSILYYYSTFLS